MDDRLKKTADVGRRDRAMDDRAVTERVELSDDQRVEMFQQQFQDAALPKIPDIPGYHVCWLTTTNPRDSIQARIRLGYEPITTADLPGWEYASQKTGEWAGFIGVNEMLACKIRADLYLRMMKAVHHEAPRAEEERMAETARAIRENLQSNGGVNADIFEGDGYEELRKAPPQGRFSV
jgi:hypothetical protein